MKPRWYASGALVLAAIVAQPAVAHARVAQDERYSFDIAWTAAVRLIRVDMGFAITERDRETGFVMFTYNDAGRTTPGSIELIRTHVDGVDGCRIVVTVPQMPMYVERHLINRLDHKLHEEFGEPPPAVVHAPVPPPSVSDHDHDRDRDRDRDRDHDADHPRDGDSHRDDDRTHDSNSSRDDARPREGTDRPASRDGDSHRSQ